MEFKATIGRIDETKEFVRLPDSVFMTGGDATQVENKMVTVPSPQLGDEDIHCVRWGKTNQHPTLIRAMVEKVPIAGQAIERRIKFLYGNGLFYYKNSDLQDGNTEIQRHYDPAIEKFLRHNRIRTHWYPNQCMDYVLFNNAFSQISLNPLTKKYDAIYHKSAEHCRISAPRKDGRYYFMLYSKHWVLGNATKQQYVPIRLYQWDDREKFLDDQRSGMYAWHTKGPGLGDLVYPKPPHEGLWRDKGWIGVACNVPEIVLGMQTNQISIKYNIIIDEEHFRHFHGQEWFEFPAKKKYKFFNEKVAQITEALSGTDNYMKTIASIRRQDDFDGKAKGSLEIVAIDDKAKTGTWIPDSDAANYEIVQGLGNDPSLAGLQPAGGKMGAGSGSDKREAYNIGTETNTVDQDILLEPLNHIAELNGWDVTFRISHTAHTTLNQNKTGQQPDSAALTEGE